MRSRGAWWKRRPAASRIAVFDIRHAGRVLVRLSATGDFCDPAGEGRPGPGRCRARAGCHAVHPGDAWRRPRIFGERLPGMNAIDALLRLRRAIPPSSSATAGASVSDRPPGTPGVPPIRWPPARRRAPAGRSAAPTLAQIAGADTDTQEQMRIAQRLYARGLPILLQGDSGSGKVGLGARASRGRTAPRGRIRVDQLRAIRPSCWKANCSATKPAPSPARRRQAPEGVSSEADGGTLFWTRSATCRWRCRPGFSRCSPTKEFVPVGASQPVRVDFNLIAASFRDIEGMVRDQAFRADLHFRIQGAALRLPAAIARRSQRVDRPCIPGGRGCGRRALPSPVRRRARRAAAPPVARKHS